MAKRVTMDQLAKQLGVSKGLISKALGGKYGVSDEMRAAIKLKAVESGYEEKVSVTGKPKCLLIITRYQISKESFWQPILSNIEKGFSHSDVLLEYFVYDLEEFDTVRADLLGKQTNGYIVLQNNYRQILDALTTTGKPIVVVDPRFEFHSKALHISCNNRQSTFDLTQYAVDRGHRRLLFYGARNFSSSFIERAEGFWQCVRENEALGTVGEEADFDNSKMAFENTPSLLEKIRDQRSTAVICANDLIAIMACKALKRNGIRIPEDVSIAGFDGIYEGELVTPQLTTMRIPREVLGAETVRHMLAAIEGEELRLAAIVVKCDLVERESVAERNVSLEDRRDSNG